MKAKRLTTKCLIKLGIGQPAHTDSKETATEQLPSDQINGFPSDPAMWFVLAAWAKQHNQLRGIERKMAYNAGRYLQNGWTLSSRQKAWAKRILEEAEKLGFNP